MLRTCFETHTSIVGSDGRGRPGGEAVALTWTRFQRALHRSNSSYRMQLFTLHEALLYTFFFSSCSSVQRSFLSSSLASSTQPAGGKPALQQWQNGMGCRLP